MPDALIISACRTPIGRFLGALSGVPATELGAVAVREAVRRAELDPAEIDEVVMGNVLAAAAGQAPARQAAIGGGIPAAASAVTINQVCGSGLQAVIRASQSVRCGDARLIVAGGMESMSRAGWVLPRAAPTLGDRSLIDSLLHYGLTCSFSRLAMGQIADRLASRAAISRERQDRFALESHRRAVQATQSGAFSKELVPVLARDSGEPLLTGDEGPRGDTDLRRLAALPAVFQTGGSVTAGNASMLSDGAAAVIVAAESVLAGRPELRPLARIEASVSVGTAPEDLFVAPVTAIRAVLKRSGRCLDEIDLLEVNEAFAVQMLACMEQLELPPDRVNIHGGAIALGHPIGASGARVLVTLLHALQRHGKRLGIAALCLGGGNAVAMLVELTAQSDPATRT